jgi:two-component system, chemotaxis family, chemotaxis protein CheY
VNSTAFHNITTSLRVMVIDDSRTVRLVVTSILRELGIEAVEARNGREALQRLHDEHNITLLLVDWNMPEMNGIDFIRAVRADEAYRGVRILMMTSESRVEQVMEALSAGADEYLMKPFNRDMLAAKLGLLDLLPNES